MVLVVCGGRCGPKNRDSAALKSDLEIPAESTRAGQPEETKTPGL